MLPRNRIPNPKSTAPKSKGIIFQQKHGFCWPLHDGADPFSVGRVERNEGSRGIPRKMAGHRFARPALRFSRIQQTTGPALRFSRIQQLIGRPLHGFTLVELLVVITIIGILISLLLPAVQAAREAARRMQCQNNLKQLALAVVNYESQWQIFPPSSSWAADASPSDSGQLGNYRANWCILVLPFLEQQALYNAFDFTKPISGSTSAANVAARSVQISTMLCPTDSRNREPFMGSQNSATSALGDNWARGNYAANAALGQMIYSTAAADLHCAALPNSTGWKISYMRGVMGANCAVTIAQVRDGTSNTVMLAEIRAGVTNFDSRGVWAMSGGSSALWGHGGVRITGDDFEGDDYGPNCPYVDSDDVIAGSAIRAAFGGSDGLIAEGMPCYSDWSVNVQQTARSMHAGGVNTCFADGSVHWIGDYIQVKPSTTTNLSVWDRLMASADGMPVASDSY